MIAHRIFNETALFVARGSAGSAGMWRRSEATGEFLDDWPHRYEAGRINNGQSGRDPVSEERRNVAHEVDTMDQKAPRTDSLQSAFEAALAEEILLWSAIHDPGLKATNRVVAYARWRTAVKRLKDFAASPPSGVGAE